MKIVLTGGPSAGKTTVATSLIKHYYHELAMVPEAATILYRGGFPRHFKGLAHHCQQRAIFKVQKELEALMKIEWPDKHLICDRGTLDGLAYWTGTQELFFTQNASSLEDELACYDVVIHLEVATLEDYNSDHSDIRVESHEKALEIDSKIKEVWSQHPCRFIVHNDISFVDKIAKVHKLVYDILSAKDLSSFSGGLI